MKNQGTTTTEKQEKLSSILEPLVFLAIFGIAFAVLANIMGGANMMNTLMNTAYQLIMDTVLYLMGITVLMGAVSLLLAEFGVVRLLNKLLSPLMKPLFGLPGAGALGILTTYLSDNPAILSLAQDKSFRSCFKKYQLPALTNLGTAFGMGMIVTTVMFGLGKGYGTAALIGNIGAIVGSIVSTRIMLHFTKKEYGTEAMCDPVITAEDTKDDDKPSHRSVTGRILDAILNGGKIGVDMGLSIIPGVVIICTIVLVLTNGPSASGEYTGAAYEGVALLPWIGDKISFITGPLFGFHDPANISVPITALGAAGAAIGLVPSLVRSGMATAHDVAVFTSMCMCWSGYLSTHVAMMSSLGCSKLTGKAILSHTIGGLCAGIAANWIYQAVALFM